MINLYIMCLTPTRQQFWYTYSLTASIAYFTCESVCVYVTVCICGVCLCVCVRVCAPVKSVIVTSQVCTLKQPLQVIIDAKLLAIDFNYLLATLAL